MFTEFILLYKVNAVYLHCVYPFIRPKKDNFNISHSKPITANSNIALSSERSLTFLMIIFSGTGYISLL
jgi:hypothetical protein